MPQLAQLAARTSNSLSLTGSPCSLRFSVNQAISGRTVPVAFFKQIPTSNSSRLFSADLGPLGPSLIPARSPRLHSLFLRREGLLAPISTKVPQPTVGKRLICMAAIPEKMKAWQYTKYGGGADGLEQVELPVPKPGPKEILLKIHASSVNPVDWKLQSGSLKLLIRLVLPVVPGTDFAGTVAAVGSDVRDYTVGDRILAKTDVFKQGGFAEYAVIDTKTVARLPPGVLFEDAAGLPVAAMTALQGLIKGGLAFPNGHGRVLVQAASGGVGHYAVQLAKHAGAHVTATASTRNVDFVKSLGADEVLDYKKVSDPGNPFQSASKEPYDVILHCTSKEEPWSHWKKVLAPHGKVVSFTPGASYLARAALQTVTFSSQKLIPVILAANSKDLQLLVDLVAEKKLKTVVDSKIPLSDAKKAWERSIDGHSVGKIIVTAD